MPHNGAGPARSSPANFYTMPTTRQKYTRYTYERKYTASAAQLTAELMSDLVQWAMDRSAGRSAKVTGATLAQYPDKSFMLIVGIQVERFKP